METINSMAASAAKAVWGENKPSTEEPVSGRLGDTSKGEPYDAGNMEPTSANTGNEAPTGASSTDLNNNATEDARFSKETGTATESKDTPDNPSTDLKAKSGPDDTTKGQNDTRSPNDPKTNPKSAPTDVDDASEEGVNEAQKLDGPGPRPVAEVAKENGGDAGNDSSSSVDKTNKGEEDTKESKESEESEEDKHESKGTGEEYVKTTGLQADGGDFDATKPGAGREADRLMAEKGIHNPTDPDSAGDSGSPTSGKKSLGQKIKDKLHRH